MTDLDKLCADLRGMMEKATPGEWTIWRESCPDRYAAIAELTDQVQATEDFVGELFLLDAGGKCPATTGCGPTSEDNAKLICAAKNALPTLLNALTALQAERDAIFAEAIEWRDKLTAAQETIGRLEEAAETAANHLGQLLGADPGPKYAAVRKAASDWWHEYDRAALSDRRGG